MRWRDACVRDLPQTDPELRLRRRGQATETEKEASVVFQLLVFGRYVALCRASDVGHTRCRLIFYFFLIR